MRIILLPGMDGTGLLFEPLLQVLPRDCATTVISYPSDRRTSYSDLIDYVKTRLPEKEDFIIVAESYSGPIGYAIACEPPPRLKAVIFVATFISKPNHFMWLFFLLPMNLVLKLTMPKWLLKHFLIGYDAEEKLVDLFVSALQTVSSHVLADRLKAMARLQPANNKIKVPCTYIAADQDRAVTYEHINEFKQVAPQLDVVTIPGPHGILQSQPAECAKVLMNCVEKYVR